MLRKQTIAGFTALLISLAVYGQTPQAAPRTAIKGYELFSWKIKSHWHYSLSPGTNRLKSYEEITAPEVVRRDYVGLKAELQKLARGETVFWRSDAPPGAKKSASGELLNVKHPSRKRIQSVKALCDKLGIKLKLS